MVTHTVPLTVCPGLGAVRATLIAPAWLFWTPTVRFAVELRPMESVTVSVSVWLPSATSCVFHTVDAVVLDVVCVNFCTPSTLKR